MKQLKNTSFRSLLNKTLLTLALVLGTSQAWAEDIVIVNGGTITTGWTKNTFITTSASDIYTNSSTMIGYIQSPDKLTFTDKKLVISGKRIADSEVFMSYSTEDAYYSYNYFFCYNMTSGATNRYEIYNNDADDYVEFISDKFSIDKKSIRIQLKNVRVNSIKLCDDKDLLLDEDTRTALSKGLKTENVIFKYTPNNKWNTICAPFKLRQTYGTVFDHLETIFGTDYKVYSMNAYDSENHELTFSTVSGAVNANTPYLVYAPNAVANPSGFSLTANVTADYATDANRLVNSVFQGIYVTKSYDALDPDWYGVTTDGQILKAGAGAYVKGYRAYFTGITPPSPDARISLVIEENGETTDLGFVKMVDPEAKEVFNLQGQRVEKGRKGIYIVNGKKVVIK